MKTKQCFMANSPIRTQTNKQLISVMTEILQWNCNGFRRQYDELQLLINKHMPTIITLQETRTNPSCSLNLKGYETIFFHRPSGQGGVGIAIKTGIQFKNVPIASNLEAIAVEVNIPRKMTVCSIYLSPNQHINREEIEKIIDSLPQPFILSGDFNAHHNQWGSHKDDYRGKIIDSITQERELIVLNDGRPTFIHSGNSSRMQNSSTCIDLSFCSAELANKLNWSVSDDQHGSDHFPILIGTTPPPKTHRPARWKIHEANWDTFEEKLEDSIQPNHVYTIEELTESIKTAALVAIPKTSTEVSHRAVPWWNQNVAEAIKLRRKTLKEKQKCKHDNPTYPTILAEFQKARNNARKIIEEAKQKSWEQYASSINKDTPTNEIWKRIRALSKKDSASNRTWAIDTENGVITNPTDIANHLAEHFHKESSNEAYSYQFQQKKKKEEKTPIKFKKHCNPKMNKEFSVSELLFQLDRLTGTSPGPDEIHNLMIKHLPYYIKIKLLEAYNNVWKNGSFPEIWRESILVPIPKPGKCPNTPDNLRPICLSSCILKLFERMVNRRLMNYLEETQTLGKDQFGFRKGHQTKDVITYIHNFGRKAIHEKKQAEIIFLDLQKAYDRTWRRLILKRLAKAGVTGYMANFCSIFLERRSFQVRYNDQLSAPKVQENGVPQGSVLAVTFFLLAVDSIKSFIPKNTFIKIYADDITIAVATKSAKWTRTKIQKILNGIQKWSTETGFKVSASKSAIMHIGKRNKLKKQTTPTLGSEEINLTNHQKLLGVWIDQKLNYNFHIKHTKDEVKQRLNIMKCLSKTKFGADRKCLLHILNMIILPKLTYGAPFYICPDRPILAKLSPIYHQGIRYATGAFHSSPIDSILSESGLLPLDLIIAKIVINYSSRQVARGILNSQLHLNSKVQKIQDELQIPTMSIMEEDPTEKLKWEEEIYRINTEIPERLPPAGKVAHFKELCLTDYHHHQHIYTDGSKMEEGVGCGIHSNDSNTSICLPPHLSIFSAEAYAILNALENGTSNLTVIFSDSKSVLEAIVNNNSNHPWIRTIKNILREKRGSAELCWVPAHVNILGNENADKLAKQGATLKNPIDVKTPFEDFERTVNDKIHQIWQIRWNTNISKLRQIKNTTSEWNTSYIKDRYFSRIITRLRIGHTKLTHGHYAKKEDPATCIACGVPITVYHVLIECRQYDFERKNNDLGTSLQEILGNDHSALEKTIKFLKDSKIHTLI